MECLKCGAKLKLRGSGAADQIYICLKCGYRGPVGLEPGIIKLDKRKKV